MKNWKNNIYKFTRKLIDLREGNFATLTGSYGVFRVSKKHALIFSYLRVFHSIEFTLSDVMAKVVRKNNYRYHYSYVQFLRSPLTFW